MTCSIRSWAALGVALMLASCRGYGPAFDPRAAPPAATGPTPGKAVELQPDVFLTLDATNQIRAEWLRAPTNLFRLGPGDAIEIESLDQRDAPDVTPVGPDGKIYYSLLPGLPVWGLSLPETKALLSAELGKYIRTKPELSIRLRTVTSRRVWVLGSVAVPGLYPLSTPMTVLEAIAHAGGANASPLATVAATDLKNSFILRGGNLLPVDIHKLLQEGDLSQNIYLEADDFVYLKPATIKAVYVLGAVASPNAIPHTERASLLSVLASVGGPMPYAYAAHVAILRGSLTKPTMAFVNYRAIATGKEPDVRVEAGDIIYVPFSRFRKFQQFGEQILSQFVRTLAVNEGRNSVLLGGQPLGITPSF